MDLNLKALNNIAWYAQLGIFASFGIVIVGLGWYFFISGLSEQIAIKQKQLDDLKVDIQKGQAVEQKHQEFQTQNKQLLSKLATLKIILPEAKQTDELLRQVQESALSSNLTIKRFHPLPVVEKDFFSEWPINLEVEHPGKKGTSLPTSSLTPPPATASKGDPGVVNYRYEVKGRRDPFRTLDVVNSIQAAAAPVVRPPGIKGQLVSEIKLVGIVK